MMEFWVDPKAPITSPLFAEDKKFIFYCASAWRSALTTKTVRDMGLTNVAHLQGGFKLWEQAGNPVVSREENKRLAGKRYETRIRRINGVSSVTDRPENSWGRGPAMAEDLSRSACG